MLKFSGFAGLTSCLGEARRVETARLKQGSTRVCVCVQCNNQRRHCRANSKRHLTPCQSFVIDSNPMRCMCQERKRERQNENSHSIHHSILDAQACAVIPPHLDAEERPLAEDNVDTEADMLSGISRKRSAHSSYY